AVGGDLGVDQQGTIARSVEPRLGGGEVVHPGDGYGVAAEAARDRGDVGGREAHRRQVEPVRPEVVDLGAVGVGVVDDHHHQQAEPPDRVQLGDTHQRAT